MAKPNQGQIKPSKAEAQAKYGLAMPIVAGGNSVYFIVRPFGLGEEAGFLYDPTAPKIDESGTKTQLDGPWFWTVSDSAKGTTASTWTAAVPGIP